MEILVLFATLFLLIVIGVPVGFAIGGATIIALYYCTDLDMVITAQYCYSGVNSFTILSIPFFTAMPSKQSMIGERYTFPAGILNSAISVNHFSLGFSAWRFRAMRLGAAGLISPR